MTRIAIGTLLLAALAALAACEPGAGGGPAAPSGGGSGGMREQLVLGSRMSFEQCQSRGGLIIRDQGSSMVACDPRVIRRKEERSDEFNHPDVQG